MAGQGCSNQYGRAKEGDRVTFRCPLFFSLAIDDSLRDVKRGMQQDEELFAFLDDLHTSSPLFTMQSKICSAKGRNTVKNTSVNVGSPSGKFGRLGRRRVEHASWFPGVHPGGVRRTVPTGDGVDRSNSFDNVQVFLATARDFGTRKFSGYCSKAR